MTLSDAELLRRGSDAKNYIMKVSGEAGGRYRQLLLTKRSGCQRVVVVHELSPGHYHDGTRVVVEAFVRVHRPGHDPR